MTLDTAKLLARYNAHANHEMNKALANLGTGEWTKDRGGYFSTIQKLLGHIYSADVAWLVRFTGLRAFKTVKGTPFDFPAAPGTLPFDSLEEYLEKRKILDGALVAFVDELTDDDLSKDLEYKNFKGEALTKNVGGLVVHLFNHQTHHRGGVSLYLDQAGVANDFSNISAIL